MHNLPKDNIIIFREFLFIMGQFNEPVQLIREAIRQSSKLEPYNEEGVRATLREICMLFEEAAKWSKAGEKESLFDDFDQARLVGVKTLIERNKRILLAYHSARLDCISSAASVVPNLPPKTMDAMTQIEAQFTSEYYQLIRGHAALFDGIDICSYQSPPHDLYVQIRVKRDCGVIQTEYGQLHLNPGSFHFVRRSDVQGLLDQGLVTHIR
jgi:GINS complex subunit 1